MHKNSAGELPPFKKYVAKQWKNRGDKNVQRLSELSSLYERRGRLSDDEQYEAERALSWAAHDRFCRAAVLASQDDPAFVALWARSVEMRLLALELDFFGHLYALRRFERGELQQRYEMMSIEYEAAFLSMANTFGWRERAKFGLDLFEDAFRRGFERSIDPSRCNFAAQFFVLVAMGREWHVEIPWPQFARDAAPYAELFEQMLDPDPTRLHAPLSKALDRHIAHRLYQVRGRSDFQNDSVWYIPYEAHLITRIRERRGLAPVQIDHPLVRASPFGPVPPEQSPSLEPEIVRLAEYLRDCYLHGATR